MSRKSDADILLLAKWFRNIAYVMVGLVVIGFAATILQRYYIDVWNVVKWSALIFGVIAWLTSPVWIKVMKHYANSK